MAIYHCSIKIISRSGGRSAVACAAYRAGEKLYDKETGTLQDYTNKGGVILSEIKLPDGAPEYFRDRETLWNEVQMAESQKNAQLAREIEVAFPKEFTREQQMLCAWDFINTNFVEKGMIADWALHDKGDGNPHAHIMLTVRGLGPDGKWMQKQKSVFARPRSSGSGSTFPQMTGMTAARQRNGGHPGLSAATDIWIRINRLTTAHMQGNGLHRNLRFMRA